MAKDSSSLMTLGLLAVGGYFAYEYLLAPAAPAAGGTPATGGTPAAGGTSTTPAVAAGTNWAGIYQALIAATGPDTQFTGTGNSRQATPYQWNFYLQRVISPSSPDTANLPDLNAVFPGVDLSQQMTAATYWTGVGAAMGAPASSLPGTIMASDAQLTANTGTSPSTATLARGPGYSAPVVTDITTGAVRQAGRSVSSAGESLSGFSGYWGLGDGGTDPNGNPCTPGWDSPCYANPYTVGATPVTPDLVAPTSFLTPTSSVAPMTLSSVPWYVWGGGAALLLAAFGSGGRR